MQSTRYNECKRAWEADDFPQQETNDNHEKWKGTVKGMRNFRIYGKLSLMFGNDYEIKLILNKDQSKCGYTEEEISGDYPKVECEWIFKDDIANFARNWFGVSEFCGESFLKHICQIAKTLLRVVREDKPFHPVLAALAGKRQLAAIVENRYWQNHCQTGELVVEMKASNGKIVRCKYQDILLRNPAISIDGGEYIEIVKTLEFFNPTKKEGQNVEGSIVFGKPMYVIVKEIDSFSRLLDIMEECASVEVKPWFE